MTETTQNAMTQCPVCRFDVAAALREPIPLTDWLRHPIRSVRKAWLRWRLDTPSKNRAALIAHVLIAHGESSALHSLSASAYASWGSALLPQP